MIDIKLWLVEKGFEHLVELFEKNDIDGEVLFDLTDEDLKDLGLALGTRKKLLKAIASGDSDGERQRAEAESPSKIVSSAPSQAPHEAERRQLTIMFVDLVGSTSLAAALDPEETRAVITSYQNAVAGVVTRFEGHVAKYMGDGVLCYFGWPKAHEDDAERAVRAGLAISNAVEGIEAPDRTAMTVRIGIATGLVVVGDLIGEGAAQEEAVIGETPNLAARLQGVADPGQVVVADATRLLLGDLFELADAGEHELKGIAGKTSAHAVTAERAAESRFEARSGGAFSEMVGRDHELGLMLERWNQAKQGEGQLVLLTGEAGIGKSRITRALIDAVADEPHVRLNYQCSPYHRDSSLYPAIQQLTFAAGIKPNDSNDEKLDKLEALLVGDDAALIAALLGLETAPRYGSFDMTPQQQRARTLKALVDQLIALSADKTVLLVLEDAHWIDASMLELLDLCLDRVATAPVLMLVTARPTFEHGFGGHPIVAKLTLNRLGRDQITAIAGKITGGKSLPAELLDEIAAKTDGIPLFVEELTKTVIESGALKETETAYELTSPISHLAIPTTLHDSLMARLDRLQPIKEVAQTAACIGREFEYRLIDSISSLDSAALREALDQLVAAEMIFRRGVVPDAVYVFKHALVRDAAYESLLKSRRQVIHARLVDALEADGEAAPELIAHHATQAGLYEKAVEAWTKAGSIAAALPAYEESIGHLRFAIGLFDHIEDRGAWRERELEILVQLAQVLMAKQGYGSEESTKVFERAAEMIDATENMELRVAIYYGMFIGPYMRADHKTCLALTNKFVDEVDRQSAAVPRLIAHRMRSATLIAAGRPVEALSDLEIAFGLYSDNLSPDFASRFAQEPGVQIKCYQLLGLWMTGYADQALSISAEATDAARKLAHANTLCYAGLHHEVLGMLCRDYDLVKTVNDEVFSIAKEHDMALWLTFFGIGDGLVRGHMGDNGSMERLEAAFAQYRAAGFQLWMTLYLAEQAKQLLHLGRLPEAAGAVQKALGFVESTGERWVESELYRIDGDIRLADAKTAEAEAAYQRAMDISRRQGAKLLELRSATDLSRLWANQGNEKAARDLLKPLYDWFTEGFGTPDLKDAKSVLDQIN